MSGPSRVAAGVQPGAVALSIGVALASLCAAGATGAGAPSPCAIPQLHLRCPDLAMSAPSRLRLDRSTIPGRVLLRATSSINNHGSGPLELRAHRRPSGAWVVGQVVYDRGHRAHLIRSAAQLVYKFVPGQRYEHGGVRSASYWKLQHAAAFQLWSIDPQRHPLRLVRSGPKVDYCLRDLFRTRPSPASPSKAVYPGCAESPRITHDILGTSVGWSDVYPYEYPEQWIDVTGLQGHFAYVQIADPNALLVESSYRDNVSEVYVSLPSGRVLGRRVNVSGP